MWVPVHRTSNDVWNPSETDEKRRAEARAPGEVSYTSSGHRNPLHALHGLTSTHFLFHAYHSSTQTLATPHFAYCKSQDAYDILHTLSLEAPLPSFSLLSLHWFCSNSLPSLVSIAPSSLKPSLTPSKLLQLCPQLSRSPLLSCFTITLIIF